MACENPPELPRQRPACAGSCPADGKALVFHGEGRHDPRMVRGLKDTLFGVERAECLDRTLPGSHGVRRVEGANLFFPEEMPEPVAEQAARLWDV
jgi:hypothetical protein